MHRQLLRALRAGWFTLMIGACAPLANAATSTIPFQATVSFNEQVFPNSTGGISCVLFGLIGGTGSSSLGDVALTSVDCINPIPPTNTFYAFTSETVVLHTASGDLYVAYSGRLSPRGVITGKYVIYGGTGELEGATGSGTLHGSEQIDQQTGTGAGQIQLGGILTL